MTRIVLRPNASLSKRRTWWLVASLALLSFVIALGFAALGFWMILPFAGLEVIALMLVFRCCLRNAACREVVSVDGDRVLVEAGSDRPERRWEFIRVWTRVLLQPATVRGYPSRLILSSAGRRIELGSFLTEDERVEVWRRLRRVIEA